VYAIIEDSGTQIKVQPGDIVDVDLRDLDEAASSVTFDRVMMVGQQLEDAPAMIGSPYLDSAKVTAEVLGEVKGDKLTVFKFKRRKGYRRKTGHRQRYLRVKISDIQS
jgi:large subunit ribosomal protein L21